MSELKHYGIPGQKWGVRRFQNPDGTLTEAGRRRYGVLDEARDRASEFRDFAIKDRSRYQKVKNVSDRDRWTKVTKSQERYYNDLMKRFSYTDVSKIDKQLIKDAKRFLKNGSYTDADYSDVALGGNRYDNYQLNYKGVDNWSKNRGRK